MLRTSASSKCSTGKACRTSVGEGRMTVGTRSAYDSTHQAARNVATPARASTRARWVLTGSRTFIATGPASPRDDLGVGAPVLGAPAAAVVARARPVGSGADLV